MAPLESKIGKITRFEAFINGSWQAFEGEVVRTKDIVSVNRKILSAEGKSFRVTNVFNLSQLEAYAFGSPLDAGVQSEVDTKSGP